MNIADLIRSGQGTILDVRSGMEFTGGHAKGAVNIPLQDIEARFAEIQQLKTPLILCCASGIRSGEAFRYLSEQNIECYNAGSWRDVTHHQFLDTK